MNKFSIFIIILISSLSGCVDSNIISFETHSIKKKNWNYKDTIKFKAEINDVNAFYDFYIDIRNSGNYPYSNLFMFISTSYPDGKKTIDTIEKVLADDNGRWLGRGLGDIKENRFVLRKSLKFPVKGLYTFKFVHAMRVMNLKGISDIGLRIEKSKN